MAVDQKATSASWGGGMAPMPPPPGSVLADHQRIKWRRNIAENFNPVSRVHERYRRQTDRQTTDGRTTTYSERERESRSLKIRLHSHSLSQTCRETVHCDKPYHSEAFAVTVRMESNSFISERDSRSRSLYVVVRPSVCNVRAPYSGD